MRTLLFLLSLFFTSAAFAKDVPLTINWKFINIVDGYDHSNKLRVYVDDVYKGESEAFNQSKTGDFTIDVSPGNHEIRILNYTFYEGKWEEHSIANDYSIDASLSGNYEIVKQSVLSIIWDLDGQSPDLNFTTGKPKKTKKGKQSTLTVIWKFNGILEGYDHDNKMSVYADGQLKGTSKEFKQSEQGKFEVKIPRGDHIIRIENYALYEGKWEKHTKENNYSIDGFVELELDMKKAKTITILFDIEKEETTYVIK